MIKIVYACNDRYLDCLQLSILSILRRTKQTIHFYVLTENFTSINPKYVALSDKNAKKMKKFVKSFNPKNEFTKINCCDLYNKYLRGNRNESSKCSPYTNLRLLIDKLGFTGKVIYLDTDIMCCGDIKELHDIDLRGKSFGANTDYLGKYWHPQHKKYINTGVMSIDVDVAKKTKLFEIARKILFRRKFRLADQTALFKAGKATESFMIFPRKYRYNTQGTMKRNTLIKHFCAGWVKGHSWQNIKQNDIKKVHEILKIHTFDEDYKVWKQLKNKF